MDRLIGKVRESVDRSYAAAVYAHVKPTINVALFVQLKPGRRSPLGHDYYSGVIRADESSRRADSVRETA